ncbi:MULTISPECIES: polysaccharide deacetylase family protein [Luteimonas]|uniref:polysaccharide deacetylase family protein n=1 Tax=Luteimonas TaxID=83614 RepID=UPI000C7E617D|nr:MULTISPECIES: polysaccharide deacetylase family protein [Luteimonas]
MFANPVPNLVPWVLAHVVALMLAAPAAHAAGAPAFAWPEGQRAAVSLAYDDALDSQLDTAIPALDRHGLKASFYLTLSADSVQRRLADWRAVARSGHELANHSLFHQCAGSKPDRAWVTPQRDLDATTVAQMQEQIALADAMLQAIDGLQQARTFTVPCGDRRARDGDYVDGLGARFVGIKVGGEAVVRDMATLDPLAVPVAAPVDMTGEALIALVDAAARRGTMVNLTFHGIGGDHLAVSTEAHAQLLAHLAAHPDLFWVDTFAAQMRWVRAQRQVGGDMPPVAGAQTPGD